MQIRLRSKDSKPTGGGETAQKEVKIMVLHFVGGKTSDNLSIIKETKKYIVFRCHDNTMKYRYNKETGEVQNGTYHNVIKGMSLDIGGSKNE